MAGKAEQTLETSRDNEEVDNTEENQDTTPGMRLHHINVVEDMEEINNMMDIYYETLEEEKKFEKDPEADVEIDCDIPIYFTMSEREGNKKIFWIGNNSAKDLVIRAEDKSHLVLWNDCYDYNMIPLTVINQLQFYNDDPARSEIYKLYMINCSFYTTNEEE